MGKEGGVALIECERFEYSIEWEECGLRVGAGKEGAQNYSCKKTSYFSSDI